jgi:restriction system protein
MRAKDLLAELEKATTLSDYVAYTDPLGTNNPRIKVQVKRQADSISADGLRSFMALLGDQDVGIYVCTGGFTSTAESEARTQERRRLTLLNLEKLFDLWVEHYEKLSESDKQLLPLRPVYYPRSDSVDHEKEIHS